MKKTLKTFSQIRKTIINPNHYQYDKDYFTTRLSFWGGMQTAACGDEERMTEPTVSSGLLPNQGNQEIPANELQQYID